MSHNVVYDSAEKGGMRGKDDEEEERVGGREK